VHGLARELGERLRIIELNVNEAIGARARAVYSNDKVAAIILLNAAGSEVYRTEGKLPRTGQVREKLAKIEASSQ